jgi:hypothetical protein
VEDVLLDWLGRYAAETPVDLLPDEQLLALANGQMDEGDLDAVGGSGWRRCYDTTALA